MMAATHTVTVPGGQWVAGVRHQDVELRPLSARDQIVLADPDGATAGSSTASRLTWLLSRCVVRLGPNASVDQEAVRELSVGDREALALHVRRLLVGDRMACVVSCPRCRERLDLDLSVDHLLVPQYGDARPWYETFAESDGAAYHVRFRLPTGRDLEEAGQLADDQQEAAADAILRRCVLDVWRDDEPAAGGLPETVAARLPGVMAKLDPQAVALLDMSCPACGDAFVVPFSPSAYLTRELIERSKRLIAEVHALALNYHWSEAAILALPERRRHAYLEMLDKSLPVWN